ncbi:MAG: ABC transporter ATP-binding protein [Deltaproteobacteria bacterium]|nr:MAG: ABC transporter ATP-binding protein [Deltaproteobacteria bacterium]
MHQLVDIRNLTKFFGATDLFTQISLSINAEDRIGLVGANGSGKSTFLKMLAGESRPDSGTIFWPRPIRIVFLPQEDRLDPALTIQETLINSLSPAEQEDTARMRLLYRVMGEAGFDTPNQPVKHLSGGWRKRLTIARALAADPELLLLDEPTNHLDIDGILWLETVLKNARFPFVMVTHDRTFLNGATTRTIELGRYYPDGYLSIPGPYAKFSEKKNAFLTQQQQQESVLANQYRRAADWLSRSPKARTTKARYRIDDALRLASDLKAVTSRNRMVQSAEMAFQKTARRTKKLLEVRNIAKAFGGQTLFSDLSFILTPGTRLGLMGPNGSGKTTLMRALAGETPPDKGRVIPAENLSIVYFDQRREQIDPDENPNLTLDRALWPEGDTVIYQGRSIHIVTWAKKFLFTPDQLRQPVTRLSGGEKARLLLARLMLKPADLLLLDEPTNDLDIPSLEVLESSLMEFPGAVILVTHDRAMLDRVTDGIIGLDSSGASRLYADYRQWLSDRRPAHHRKKTKTTPSGTKPSTPRTAGKLSYKYQRELDGMEAAIESAEAEVSRWEKAVGDPETASDAGRLTDACNHLNAALAEVDRLYARWETLEAMQAADA